jgi:hypothetical protein
MTSFTNERSTKMTRLKPDVGAEGVGRQPLVKLLLLSALVAGTMLLVIPATASADARVQPGIPCVAYANAGATFYSGSGTEVVTDTGNVVASCHLTLVSGAAVAEPTRTTYGNCELLQLPSGRAQLTCHYALF